MLAKILECSRLGAGEAARFLLGENIHRTVDADGEHVLRRVEVRIGAVMQHEGSEAAEIRHDRLAGFGMDADFARQRQKLQRLFERDVLGLLALGDRGTLWLLAFDRLAKLQIGAKAANTARDLLARLGINTQQDAVGRYGFRAVRRG